MSSCPITHISGSLFSNRGQAYVQVRHNMCDMAGCYGEVRYLVVVVNSPQEAACKPSL